MLMVNPHSLCTVYRYLKPGGALVMKIYEGAGINEFIRDMQVRLVLMAEPAVVSRYSS